MFRIGAQVTWRAQRDQIGWMTVLWVMINVMHGEPGALVEWMKTIRATLFTHPLRAFLFAQRDLIPIRRIQGSIPCHAVAISVLC